jgi:nitric oxide reductase activation protein
MKGKARDIGERLGRRPSKVSQYPIDSQDGTWESVAVYPVRRNRKKEGTWFQEYRQEVRSAALAFSRRLKRLVTEIQAPRYRQKTGALNRRQLVDAMKGESRVYVQPGSREGLSMAVSLVVDVSGSLTRHFDSVRQSVLLAAQALEAAGIPYEVRTFGVKQHHLKSFGDRQVDEGRFVSGMADLEGATVTSPAIALSRLALGARRENARFMFVFTDGTPDNPHAVSSQVQYAREQGLHVFCAYFDDSAGQAGTDPYWQQIQEQTRTMLNEQYGQGWTTIDAPLKFGQAVMGKLEGAVKAVRRGR